jgi:hypothetical protein
MKRCLCSVEGLICYWFFIPDNEIMSRKKVFASLHKAVFLSLEADLRRNRLDLDISLRDMKGILRILYVV